MSKGIIIQVLSVKGILINYIIPKEDRNGFQLRHRTKFKELIYGDIFTYYHPEMNFSNSHIIIDNR